VYGLRVKILEVDGWVRHAGRRVVEVHPEVSFADAGVHLADELGQAGRHAAVDDVLDAGAAAWTAARVATGAATPLPDPPVEHSDGWPAAIWR
jgi:predicted RNase H-like nuclease